MKVKSIPCWECFGTGLVHMQPNEPCLVCNGEGEYFMTERVEHNERTMETIEQIRTQDRI